MPLHRLHPDRRRVVLNLQTRGRQRQQELEVVKGERFSPADLVTITSHKKREGEWEGGGAQALQALRQPCSPPRKSAQLALGSGPRTASKNSTNDNKLAAGLPSSSIANIRLCTKQRFKSGSLTPQPGLAKPDNWTIVKNLAQTHSHLSTNLRTRATLAHRAQICG